MTRPTTEAGKWLEDLEPYLSTWAWSVMGTPVIVAIEAQARESLLLALRGHCPDISKNDGDDVQIECSCGWHEAYDVDWHQHLVNAVQAVIAGNAPV